MEPTGWDSQDRVLFVLDDNRMYRRTDPPPPPQPKKAAAKSKSKKGKGARASKRQKVSTPEPEEPIEEKAQPDAVEDDGLGGMRWECLCVTLEDYQEYLNSIRRSRDPNEKILYKRIEEEVIPVMEGLAEEQAKKQARKQRELENLQKLATAKRSSRISSRLEKQKEQDDVVAEEQRRQAELAQAKADLEKQKYLEEVRPGCMLLPVVLIYARHTILAG
jgi:DNA primase